MSRWAWIVGLAGCGSSSLGQAPVAAPPRTPPTIASMAFGCDTDAGRWTLELRATAWSGGADSYWTVDGAYVEQHPIDAVAYAEDGSGETLELSMGIVADWRTAGPALTAFECAEPVDVLVVLSDLDGVAADCRSLGPDPARWAAIDDTPDCDRIWTTTTSP